ncbi:MAG: MBOAT family protein [Ruminococcus flavefaciens]|nr:MBOAT family protein [Ruminococcus flavefaciens]
MLFNSTEFLIFFPVVVLIYFVIPLKIRNFWLLIASYFFYMCWNARYIVLILASTIITYITGIILNGLQGGDIRLWIFSGKTVKKIVLVISISLNLAILFYFKYFNFAVDILGSLLWSINIELRIPKFDILLPVGISFYTFQVLGYIIDVYRGEIYAEKNFFRYALFVSFFPQLVAGPIEKSKNLLTQMVKPKKFNYDRVREGLLLMLWGFFLKLVIANRCAVLVDTVYGDYTSYGGIQFIIANTLFAFQIYCDFMGYSVIARGGAKVIGYELTENFLQPYLAQSIKEFWHRWHISLSTWLKDYIYISLGGSRKGKKRKYGNLILTFLVSGLWHGANMTFVIWGMLHGLYQVIGEQISLPLERFYKKLHISTQQFSWQCLRILKTFILTDIAWVFFRSDTILEAIYILKKSLELSNAGLILNGGLYQLGLDAGNISILLLGLVILAVYSVMRELGLNVMSWMKKQNILFRYMAYWGAVILIVFSMDSTGQEFIYFQF